MTFEDIISDLIERQSKAVSALPVTVNFQETAKYTPPEDINLPKFPTLPQPQGLDLRSAPYENLSAHYRNFGAIPIGDLVDYALRSKARRSILRERMADIDAAVKQDTMERGRALLPYMTTGQYYDILGKSVDTSLKRAVAPFAVQKSMLDSMKARQELAALPPTILADITGKMSAAGLTGSQGKMYESMFKENPTLMNMYSSFLGMLSELFGE